MARRVARVQHGVADSAVATQRGRWWGTNGAELGAITWHGPVSLLDRPRGRDPRGREGRGRARKHEGDRLSEEDSALKRETRDGRGVGGRGGQRTHTRAMCPYIRHTLARHTYSSSVVHTRGRKRARAIEGETAERAPLR